MIIDCAHYVAGVRAVEPMSLGDAGRLARQTEGFVWVALSDPAADELDELGTAFDVPRFALESDAGGLPASEAGASRREHDPDGEDRAPR